MDNKKELVFGPIEELPQLFKGCDRVVELGDTRLCVAKRWRLLDKNSGVFKPFQYNPSAVIKDWAVHFPFSHAGTEVGIKQAKLNQWSGGGCKIVVVESALILFFRGS